MIIVKEKYIKDIDENHICFVSSYDALYYK